MIDTKTQTREEKAARAELIRKGLLIPANQQKAAVETHQRFVQNAGLPDFLRQPVR